MPNARQTTTLHTHCSLCARPVDPSNTDQGYTHCCNEPVCYGDGDSCCEKFDARYVVISRMSDGDLIAAYRRSADDNAVGVNYDLAQEMQRRGLRNPKTAKLTRKAQRTPQPLRTYNQTLADAPRKRGRKLDRKEVTVGRIDTHSHVLTTEHLAGLTDDEFEKLADALRREGKRRRAARRRSA